MRCASRSSKLILVAIEPGCARAASTSARSRSRSPVPSTASWAGNAAMRPATSGEQIGTFLRREPADHAEQRTLRRYIEIELTLQRSLVARFRIERARVVVAVEQRIAGRVPDALVDAVQDAGQGVATLRQHAFESHAERCMLDLSRIRRTDRRQPVGEHQACLQERRASVVFDAFDTERLAGKAKERRQVAFEDALEREVVNRHQRLRMRDRPHGSAPRARVRFASRCSGGCPVAMRADCVRLKAAPPFGTRARSAARCRRSPGPVRPDRARLRDRRAPDNRSASPERRRATSPRRFSPREVPRSAAATRSTSSDRCGRAPIGRPASAAGTSRPSRRSCAVSAPATSPRPPVLTQGAHSGVAYSTRMRGR